MPTLIINAIVSTGCSGGELLIAEKQQQRGDSVVLFGDQGAQYAPGHVFILSAQEASAWQEAGPLSLHSGHVFNIRVQFRSAQGEYHSSYTLTAYTSTFA